MFYIMFRNVGICFIIFWVCSKNKDKTKPRVVLITRSVMFEMFGRKGGREGWKKREKGGGQMIFFEIL